MMPSNERLAAPAVIPCSMELLTDRLFPAGIVAGQQILLSGEPGASKSTFLLQAINGFIESGVGCAYISSEQRPSELEKRLRELGQAKGLSLARIHEVNNLETLSNLISQPNGSVPLKVLVIDSLQGLGLNASAQREWDRLFGLMQFLRLQQIATFYIAHVTKDLKIAGPKKLEHEVDAVFNIRKAFAYRLMSVSKNRYGPSSTEPVVCTVDRLGRLYPAQKSPDVLVAKTMGFSGGGLVEVEAKVEFSLSSRSRRPALSGVTRPGYMKIVSILRGMGVDIGGFGSQVACNLPGGGRCGLEQDLAVALALLSSYLQLPLRDDPIFCGELGLDGELRFVHPAVLQRLVALVDQDLSILKRRTIVLERDSAAMFKSMLEKTGKGKDLIIVRGTSLAGVAHHLLLHEPAPEPVCLDQEGG